jgi:hypothetical protein
MRRLRELEKLKIRGFPKFLIITLGKLPVELGAEIDKAPLSS